MATKRLLREASDLRRQPTPHFHASPLPSNIFEWHFTLLGPPSPSPFASGIYHGRIVLPPTYPLRPPSFRFMTPSGRFETNTEICLSISGFHEETWQPAWGIRLALTALRSFMDEGAKGQIGALDASVEVRKRLARESKGWRCHCGEGECAGKTNEEILKGWWEECREMGIDVKAEVEGEGAGRGKGEVPKELRIGEKKDDKTTRLTNAQRLANETPTAQTEEKSILDPPRNDTSAPSSPSPHHSSDPKSTSSATSASTSSFSEPSAPQSLPSTFPQQQAIQSSPSTSDNTPSPSQTHHQPGHLTPNPHPPPTTTSSTSPATINTTPHNPSSPTTTTTAETGTMTASTPWLDKAISGVILALIVMVLRRAVASGDFYE